MAKLYVAYGSNLNKDQMQWRCPRAKFVGTGVIEDYELQFKGSLRGAHATIAPKEGSSVPVGVWTIQELDEERLDNCEGYHKKGYCYYDKEQIPVKMDDGHSIHGMVYIMDQQKGFGYPCASYIETVAQGYRDCGLDMGVLEQALIDCGQKAHQRMESQYAGMQMM